jgi:hypothetical protein
MIREVGISKNEHPARPSHQIKKERPHNETDTNACIAKNEFSDPSRRKHKAIEASMATAALESGELRGFPVRLERRNDPSVDKKAIKRERKQ